jgi:hypothetical protein
MTNAGRAILLTLVGVMIAGCVASTAVPVRRDLWKLQVTADPAASPRQTEARVLREAAALAFRNGFTHFRLSPTAPDATGEAAVRAVLYGDTRLFLVAPGPQGEATTEAAVMVEMLNADDPGAERAYRALDVLSR